MESAGKVTTDADTLQVFVKKDFLSLVKVFGTIKMHKLWPACELIFWIWLEEYLKARGYLVFGV